ncbi:MAG: D-alanine--D-alanine ligase [Parcubacteria group bacterium]|nr:D-alanine--D-alanine ligase [Parcubacteria group bacterium]
MGVLRGGASSEHEVSLRSGHAILRNLPEDRYSARDIYIDKQGVWHEHGVPTSLDRVLPTIDVAVLPLHGEGGQDGEIQKVLERYGVPYTGASSFAAFTASHKLLAKEKAAAAGLLTPKYRFIQPEDDAEAVTMDIIRNFAQPVVVKPVRWGSSVGVSIVGGYAPVHQAIAALLPHSGGVLVEELIRGTEATVGVVDHIRGETVYALPPIEILPPPDQEFFNYEAKYSGATREICPGNFTKSVSEELMQMARTMHTALEQRHYSRSDFIVSPRGIYYLETNTAAAVGMTEQSLFPVALSAVGIKFPDFLSHVVELALGRTPSVI